MTALVVPLMIGVLAAGSPELWVVRLADGSCFTAVAPPEHSGRLAIAELDDGTPVSVRADRIVSVDRLTPTESNDSGPADQVNQLGPAAGDAPRVMDNTTLDAFMAALPAEDLPEPSGDARLFRFAASVEPAQLPPRREPGDKYGRGRRYWEERARPATAAVRRARLAEEVARRRLEEAERDLLFGSTVYASQDGGFSVTHYAQRGDRYALIRHVQILRDRLELAIANRTDAEQSWASLREEARRAGAWPGWLRVP
jgi:hypothetical protein